MRKLTYSQAISEALVQAMERDPNVFIFGLGVDDWKGIFGTTKEAFEKFGNERVFDAPASEGALTGIAIGAACNGKRPVLVHARNDFMFLALDQMLNMAAKWKYVYGGQSSVPVVFRGIIGKGWGQGATHSQSIQSLFVHFPGIYVAMPSSPYIAKGLLLNSLSIDTPVVIIEHRSLFDDEEDVPENEYAIEFGKAKVFREGKDVTIVATSLMVRESLKAAELLKDEGIEAEVIDPISLKPLDEETILKSVSKTGRLVCADTSWMHCGFASEVSALVAEKGFDFLTAPIKRVTWPECSAPVSKALENVFYPDFKDVSKAVCDMLKIEVPQRITEIVQEDKFLGPY